MENIGGKQRNESAEMKMVAERDWRVIGRRQAVYRQLKCRMSWPRLRRILGAFCHFDPCIAGSATLLLYCLFCHLNLSLLILLFRCFIANSDIWILHCYSRRFVAFVCFVLVFFVF